MNSDGSGGSYDDYLSYLIDEGGGGNYSDSCIDSQFATQDNAFGVDMVKQSNTKRVRFSNDTSQSSKLKSLKQSNLYSFLNNGSTTNDKYRIVINHDRNVLKFHDKCDQPVSFIKNEETIFTVKEENGKDGTNIEIEDEDRKIVVPSRASIHDTSVLIDRMNNSRYGGDIVLVQSETEKDQALMSTACQNRSSSYAMLSNKQCAEDLDKANVEDNDEDDKQNVINKRQCVSLSLFQRSYKNVPCNWESKLPTPNPGIFVETGHECNDKEEHQSLLLTPLDKPFSTSFTYYLFEQMQPCVVTKEDLDVNHPQRKGLSIGYPGLACRHCLGGVSKKQKLVTDGRYFPKTKKAFFIKDKSFLLYYKHMMKCKICPTEVQQTLDKLRGSHEEERAKMKYGTIKPLLERVWERLHGKNDASASSTGPQVNKCNSKVKNDTACNTICNEANIKIVSCHENDVILGYRDLDTWKGNTYFRKLLQEYKEEYRQSAPHSASKKQIITKVIDAIAIQDPPGRFIAGFKKDQYYMVSRKDLIINIKEAFRTIIRYKDHYSNTSTTMQPSPYQNDDEEEEYDASAYRHRVESHEGISSITCNEFCLILFKTIGVPEELALLDIKKHKPSVCIPGQVINGKFNVISLSGNELTEKLEELKKRIQKYDTGVDEQHAEFLLQSDKWKRYECDLHSEGLLFVNATVGEVMNSSGHLLGYLRQNRIYISFTRDNTYSTQVARYRIVLLSEGKIPLENDTPDHKISWQTKNDSIDNLHFADKCVQTTNRILGQQPKILYKKPTGNLLGNHPTLNWVKLTDTGMIKATRLKEGWFEGYLQGGYWHISSKKDGDRKIHRLMVECIMKRVLTETEVADHINGVRTDNNIDNLQPLMNYDNNMKSLVQLVTRIDSEGHAMIFGSIQIASEVTPGASKTSIRNSITGFDKNVQCAGYKWFDSSLVEISHFFNEMKKVNLLNYSVDHFQELYQKRYANLQTSIALHLEWHAKLDKFKNNVATKTTTICEE